MLNSTPARSCSALPKPINDDPAAAWPRATPGRNWVVLDVAARHRMVVRTESLRIPNWHDTGSTSPRSGSEVALIWDTISHYSPVLIAPLAINFIAPARPEKKERIAVKPTRQPSTQREATLTGRPFFTKSPADGLVAAPQAGTGARSRRNGRPRPCCRPARPIHPRRDIASIEIPQHNEPLRGMAAGGAR